MRQSEANLVGIFQTYRLFLKTFLFLFPWTVIPCYNGILTQRGHFILWDCNFGETWFDDLSHLIWLSKTSEALNLITLIMYFEIEWEPWVLSPDSSTTVGKGSFYGLYEWEEWFQWPLNSSLYSSHGLETILMEETWWIWANLKSLIA